MEKVTKQKKSPDAPRERQALLCLSVFFHRYLTAIYGDEDLDLVSVSLLNEIAQHNLEPFAKRSAMPFPTSADEIKMMRGCNAFSLSQSTGVPRETVRRKIKQLVELGWVEPHNRKGLFITTHWMDRLSRDVAASLLDEFGETSGRVSKLLRD